MLRWPRVVHTALKCYLFTTLAQRVVRKTDDFSVSQMVVSGDRIELETPGVQHGTVASSNSLASAWSFLQQQSRSCPVDTSGATSDSVVASMP